MKIVEQKLKHCTKCEKETIHHRNNTKTGLIMILVHIVLTIATMGAWLVLLVIWKLLTVKIGGWKCEACPQVSVLHKNIF